MNQRLEYAPAKINLGLEILGKRPDGYHEVRTVLAMISLRDTLVFQPSNTPPDVVTMDGDTAGVPDQENLVARALRAMRDVGAAIPPQRVTVTKRVPAAAGLGGASSDAAATIRAFAGELRSAKAIATEIAASLGSDVPFFLNGPIALASGRGDVLSPLPQPKDDRWIVLALPNIDIPDKTRTMYAAVDCAWWSDGSAVQRIAADLPILPSTAPFNVFEHALLALHPELYEFRAELRAAGYPFVALTGAGPTFYTLVEARDAAQTIACRLKSSGVKVLRAKLGGPGQE